MARWHTLSAASRETLWRSLHTLNITRIVIAMVLLLLYLNFDSKAAHPLAQYRVAEIGLGYLLTALVCALLTVTWRRRFMLQLGAQIALDLAVISLLYLGAGGARGPLVTLYLFPLAGAAILAPRMMALFAVALVTLFLIGESALTLLAGDVETALLQSGVYGAAFFAAVSLLSQLAAKLIGQEELAARRGADLNVQQAINRIVMADVGDGILVAAPSGLVLASNPAAQRMLGLAGEGGEGGPFTLAGNASLAPIAHAFEAWLALAPDSPAGAARAAFVTVRLQQEAGLEAAAPLRSVRPDLAAHLKLRFARVDTPDQADGRCVIFLQDVTAIENQAQQLKLASMGRLTASIAHEVRNPLSAIGHATALLAEDLAGPGHARLLKIVGDNVARVNRMVEDILQLSRKVQPHAEPLALGTFL
ncbi:MAG: two-component sensor histidine kinase, partial [Massilia sp.]|nr:two-component sensor histidine kinase [Massilia sp.]